MRKNGLKQAISFVMSLSMIFSTNLMVNAATLSDIYVGDVVSLSASDLQVKSNYRSASDVTKEYSEDVSNLSTNNTSISSGGGNSNSSGTTGTASDMSSMLDSLIDSAVASNGISSKVLSYDEFMKLIGSQNSTIKSKYDAANENAKNSQKQATKEAAQSLRDALEKAMKGINPVTGEVIGDGEDIYSSLAALGEEVLNEFLNTDITPDEIIFDNDTYNKKFQNFAKNRDKNAVLAGNQNFVEYTRLDESDYSSDKLYYVRNDDEYTDIKYTCSKCGKTYGFNEVCDCGKFLVSAVLETAHDKSGSTLDKLFGNLSSFKNFGEDGKSNIHYDPTGIGSMKCMICGKSFSRDNVDFSNDEGQFMIGTNNNIVCKSCYDITSTLTKEQVNSSNVTEVVKKAFDGKTYNGSSVLALWSEIYDNDYTLDDSSEWGGATLSDIKNKNKAYYDDIIIPAKLDSYSSDYVSGKTADEVIENYRNNLSDEEKEEFDKNMAEYENAKKDLDDFINDEGDKAALEEVYNNYYDHIKDNAGESDIPGKGTNYNLWTDEEKNNVLNAISSLINSGIPSSSVYSSDTERIIDTSDYQNNINKIFGEWPSDKSMWTTAQKELYDEMYKKYSNDSGFKATLDDIINKGIISKDKTVGEMLNGIDNYIANFTSINESVTVKVMTDSVGNETVSNKKNYTVQGDILLTAIAPDGSTMVSDYTIAEGIPYRFCPDQAGKYTLKRKVRIYDIEWQIVSQNYDVKAVVELPDGSTEVIQEKQVTKIKEDKSGLKSSNMREMSVADITVNVKERTLDIDKKDFYDTERVD